MSIKKRLLGNLTLVFISLGICFILAEIILRQFYPIDTETSISYRIPHPTFGWVLEPGASYYNKMPEDTVHVTYNSKGFRDDEHDLENDDHKFRILVLGDSFMEAYSVGLNEAFHKQVETYVGNTGIEVETINMGTGGYGTLQEYLVFRENGKLYKPDVVLLGFYVGNDVRNNSFPLDSIFYGPDSEKTRTRPFLESSNPEDWTITQVDFEGARRRFLEIRKKHNFFLKKLARQSIVAQILKKPVYKILDSFLNNKAESLNEPADMESQYLALYGVHYCQENIEYKKAWDTTKRILARLNRDIKKEGSKLFVFTVPALHEVDTSEMKKIIANAPDPAKLCLEEAMGYKRLINILKELDIEHLDLLPAFQSVMQGSDTKLFWYSDEHWNPDGHALAAKTVVSSLMERKLLPYREYKDSLR